MTENQIIEEIRNGNQKILAETYDRYRKEFAHWAHKNYHCSTDDSKEIYQITFFVFYDNVLSGKLERLVSNLKTYLFAIGKHKILENNRRNNRYSFDIKRDMVEVQEDDEELRHYKEQQYEQVSQGLQKLGNPCRGILELMYYQNFSIKEITERFGFKNTDTTKNQKYKCMQRLKKIVEKIIV